MITKTYNQDLSGKNTFGMKVACRTFIEYDSISDLFELDFEDMLHPVKHIGGGSNLLLTKDFPGTILHSAVKFIERLPVKDDEGGVPVSVGAGVVFDDFCAWAASEGLWGPENLSHIPGEVGAAAVQNIGAYGVEACDIIDTVYAFDTLEEEFVHFKASQCGYGYRESMFKRAEFSGRYIITHVVFHLSLEPHPVLDYGHIREALDGKELTPAAIRQTITDIRMAKLPEPSQMGSAGSFFKNPVVDRQTYEAVCKAAGALVNAAAGSGCASASAGASVPHYDLPDGTVKIPAAWLIEQCGYKGRRCGNAAVWDKQPLVIVNYTGRALPEEIVALEQRIIADVRQRFGITLHPEVEHI